ncbi:hypothetical protein K1719_001997 [Acacia pycnantha]|nr:hypothetical protein K1719_001997 [Acacia pycnantha]
MQRCFVTAYRKQLLKPFQSYIHLVYHHFSGGQTKMKKWHVKDQDLFLAKASKSSTKIGILDMKVVSETTCPEPNIEPWEMPYVHYPKLKSLQQG